MQTLWTETPRDEAAEARLTRELGIHPLTARLLSNRSLLQPEDAELFLNPKLTHLHDPFGLPDMDKAARRIVAAIDSGEKIFVHGDYDVDGVTSTALYVRALSKLGANVIHRVPNRHIDGYDLKQGAIAFANEEGAKLVITTDCGIQAREAVDYANSLGLCVIITDHHEPGDILPNAYAIVNPRRHDSTYPFPALAGVGVAYKTMQAVTRLMKPEWEAAFIQNFLDLVAVGTVADVMPLMGENRVLAFHGLEALRRTKKVGLRSLLEGAAIDTTHRLSADAVGFGIGPRINAVGRLESAGIALDLLLTTDGAEAQRLVTHLNEVNRERQVTQKIIQLKAIEKVILTKITDRPVLIVHDRSWNTGIIGIVAGKLVEQFHKPAIVIGVTEDGVWGKGSARSIPAFDIFKGIATCQELLETCGGHSHAAGLSLSMERFEEFYDKLCAHASSVLKPEDFQPQIRLDAIIDGNEITMALLEEWDQFQPHGLGNPAPLLATERFKLGDKRRIGKDLSHLKFTVTTSKAISSWHADCVGWGLAAAWDNQLEGGDEIDMVYAPSINTYQGKRSLQLVVKDLCMGGCAPVKPASPTPGSNL